MALAGFALIASALPELLAAERALRVKADALGIEYRVADFGGLRTEADTNRILGYRKADYAAAVKKDPKVAKIPIETWRPIAPFGSSYHNYGAAFDVRITKRPAGVSESAALAKLGALAPSVGLRWGGTFSAKRSDPPHFELAISLADAKARWQRFAAGREVQPGQSNASR